MDRYYLHEDAYHVIADGDDRDLPEGAVEIDRLPADGESWDSAKKKLVVDYAIKADLQVSAAHIERAHLLKELEATMVLSGVQLNCGLLVQEAELKSMSVEDLAAQVYAISADDRAAELSRMGEKSGGI